MENQFVWKKQYNIGVDTIDNEHKRLFRILNKLYHFGRQDEKSRWVCQEAVKYFKEHTLQHFANEEAYMASINYTGLETHKRIHKNFRERTLPALEQELEQTNYSEQAINHFFGVCAGWLVGHTLVEDHMIVNGDDVKHWDHLLPEEEQAVMGQTIAGLLHQMFQLNSHIISDCYGGEKFGNEIYSHLIYSSKEKKKWDIFIIFEEQLIGSVIGGVADTKSEAVSVMFTNVAKYAARQLVERAKSQFPFSEQFELEEEHTLTDEQFQKLFQIQSPQFSLLFDTGKGYFAYCMTASHMHWDQRDVSVITENAMGKAINYLNQTHGEITSVSQKKKLLIVDDSDFILNTMRNLLRSEYTVATAKSGLSAIRNIALDRPDLILLDYEMPVCNGSQVLEMIRSEQDFTDIPVIFLTNRVDKETVKKVLTLGPEGYLSKALPPESVKQEIDRFFEKKGCTRINRLYDKS
ncbi:MAG: response regulator [Lachnospiraceae bacterium]|nr:response regulator [Lachnospiraceae bacterium]